MLFSRYLSLSLLSILAALGVARCERPLSQYVMTMIRAEQIGNFDREFAWLALKFYQSDLHALQDLRDIIWDLNEFISDRRSNVVITDFKGSLSRLKEILQEFIFLSWNSSRAICAPNYFRHYIAALVWLRGDSKELIDSSGQANHSFLNPENSANLNPIHRKLFHFLRFHGQSSIAICAKNIQARFASLLSRERPPEQELDGLVAGGHDLTEYQLIEAAKNLDTFKMTARKRLAKVPGRSDIDLKAEDLEFICTKFRVLTGGSVGAYFLTQFIYPRALTQDILTIDRDPKFIKFKEYFRICSTWLFDQRKPTVSGGIFKLMANQYDKLRIH